jgi:hypothetical protein
LPEGEPGPLGFQIPQRVHYGANRHVHDALFWAKPPQLRVADEFPPGGTHRVEQLLDIASDQVRRQRRDRCHLDVVTASDREDEGVPLQPVGVVGDNLQVGG